MRRIKEVLRLKVGLGLSDTAVSRSVRIARSTVKEYLDRAAAAGLNWETAAELSEEDLDHRLFAAADTRHPGRPLPDWEAVEKELRGRGVTLRLLWLEYLNLHPEGYRYTQFCTHFRVWQRRSRPPTMRRPYRAGEAFEVDWAGMTLSIIDTTDKDGPIMDLLAAEITARTGKDPGEHYRALTAEFGTAYYTRIDASATPEQKARLEKLSPEAVKEPNLAGEPIVTKLTRAPGNGAPIGGLKVVARSGWFAARPSGTEAVYKIYAESFKDKAHLDAIASEAQAMVDKALGSSK